MRHKAAIVPCLCLQALFCGLEVVSEGIDSLTDADTGKVFCPEEAAGSDLHGQFIFPKTEANKDGVTVKAKCPFGFRNDGLQSFYGESEETEEIKRAESGAIRKCIRHDSANGSTGEWYPSGMEMEIKHCKQEGCDELLERLKNASENVGPIHYIRLFSILSYAEPCAINDYENAMVFINGIDTVLKHAAVGPDTFLSVEDKEDLLNMVGKFAEKQAANLRPGFKLQIGQGGIFVETAKFYGIERYLKSSYDEAVSLDQLQLQFQLQPYVTHFATLETAVIDIEVSAEALLHSMQNVPNDRDPQLKIMVYSGDVFKIWNEKKVNATVMSNESVDGESLTSRAYQETVVGNCTSIDNCNQSYKTWGMLSIELDGTIHDLVEPIEFSIRNYTTLDEFRMKCVFWDSETETWSTEGLETVQISDGIKCRSSHLTAFSALIEPLPLPFPGAEYAPVNNSVHGFILSILSSIGSVCSIIGLSFTLLTYGLFRSLRRERSNRILINLCISLLLLHIMSISGSKSLWDGFCFVPAASLHYLVLTSLAWMMVEAIHMYELLISVFVRPENRFLIKRLVLAWGFPLIIVGICAFVKPNVYKVGRADLCLMSAHENILLYYFAYIGPICIMLLVNISIFLRVFRVLYQQTKRTNKASHGQKISTKYQFVKISPSQIKGATTVLVLLGIGWVLGLLAMGPFEVLFRYMYCICNAGQGLLIFIFRVLLNPQANKQWKKVIIGLSSENSLDASVATSTTGGGRERKRKSTTISPTFISASNSVENSLTASNPLSANLATALASILKSEDIRAREQRSPQLDEKY